jgi:hypothetical protein
MNDINKNNTQDSYGTSPLAYSYSNKQSNFMKRLLLLLTVTTFLTFTGVQARPTNEASAAPASDITAVQTVDTAAESAAVSPEPCTFTCSAPFISPDDGQCYQMCCPADENCKRPCELRPCVGKPGNTR